MFGCFKDIEERPSRKDLNTIPFARTVDTLPSLETRGKYPQGKPEGIIIHFTAGRYEAKARDFFSFMASKNLVTLFIDNAGVLWQQHKLDEWGSHAGSSVCPETKRAYVSRYYIGIEVACPGKLKTDGELFKTWYGEYIPQDKVRTINTEMTEQRGFIHSGYYAKFEERQMHSLNMTCSFLCKHFEIDPKFIFGHDEVAPDRKNDPGGSLNVSMEEYRKFIRGKM
jgi:N-acetyl-anhydromuramyl-L-alanine amidase AmpD